ncbi:hypothetical protein SAMN05421579_1436 [Xenorhabdus japonica]|uniref:Uncharacterized protein n=1 Tax=Xenorhabdus japonica TaxID=53341 RepID=A0A1I5DLZ8_9GAMM|nr:hypothetical protein SAMN05421579_1436 [Xenorhabdus japonica]
MITYTVWRFIAVQSCTSDNIAVTVDGLRDRGFINQFATAPGLLTFRIGNRVLQGFPIQYDRLPWTFAFGAEHHPHGGMPVFQRFLPGR